MRIATCLSLLAVVLQPIWASPFTLTINGVTNSAAVESFSFGALSSVDAASGLATGKLSSTATLRRKADSSSPGLYKMLFTNAIADIVIKDGLNDPNGKQSYTFSLRKARIAQIESNGTGTSSSIDTIRFVFAGAEVAFSNGQTTTTASF